MVKKLGKEVKRIYLLLVMLLCFLICGCSSSEAKEETGNKSENISSEISTEVLEKESESFSEQAEDNKNAEEIQNPVEKIDLSSVPEYSGNAYIEINNNEPFFSQSEISSKSFEHYSDLDNLGRCGMCVASIGKDIMPTDERGKIGSVKPSGWQTVKYNDVVDGNYLYNRCHLIGFQLTGENANTRNLITGTRYMNVEGMLPFENMVADYVKETENHVMYRVTPIFKENNLVASGVLMEAKSVEDNGEGILFNVFCYNVQPGIEINYADGSSKLSETVEVKETTTIEQTSVHNQPQTQAPTQPQTQAPTQSQENSVMVWIPKSGSKYHSNSECSNMKNPSQTTLEEAISRGFEPCKKCY